MHLSFDIRLSKMSGSHILSLLICSLYGASGFARLDPLVETGLGQIRGLTAPDGDYSMFLGIPYATVDPANPFGVSIPHTGFNDTFEASDDSAICPQVEYFSNVIAGTLDCLRLNVYVPNAANTNNRRSVLVWFHGGAFVTGYAGRAFYGPKFLVKNDVILVTVNYRLGPYGFFCLDIPEVPGNQGLKDQQTALKWVKNNIGAFGGDSNSITIFGESAGGSSVNHHLLFNKEVLFNKVIIQSVPAISPFSLSESNADAPLKLSEYLGHKSDNLEDALSFLATVHTDEIISAVGDLKLQFRPCVEKKFENVEQLISDYPINVKVPTNKNVPILIGYNDNEALFSHGASAIEGLQNIFHDNLETYFNFDTNSLTDMESIVRHYYIGDKDITEHTREQIVDFISDFRYVHPVHRTIEKYIAEGTSTIYFYVFSYEGGRNLFKARSNITAHGAAHTDELSYLFDVAVMDQPISPQDQIVIDRITALWSNFAKYSNPTPEISELLPVQWPITTSNQQNYLDIGTELIVKKRPFSSRVSFWDLFYKLNEEFQIGYRKINKKNH